MSARTLATALVVLCFLSIASDAPAQEAIYGNGYHVMAGRGPDGSPKIPNVDAAGNVVATGPICSNTSQAVVSVGTTAVLVPSAPLAGRKALRICVSLENAGSPKVKCLLGGTPVLGIANPGDVLAPGDCYPYAIDSSVAVRCIADTAGTAVTTFECS